MDPELELARQFHLSEADARAYIQAVQKRFPHSPSARGILIFIRDQEKLKNLPPPDELARRMTRNKTSLGKPVPGHIPKPAANIPARQRRGGFSNTSLVYESNLDHERLPPEQQECCPHGVPKPGPCAICNPKEFRLLTGID